MAAPEIIADTQIARLAFTEAQRIASVPIPADHLNDAHYYVDQGFKTLSGSGNYDPRVLAKDYAIDAVVAYVKARLLGVPVDKSE